LESLEEGESHEKVSFEDIKRFSATFWILVLICMLTLGVYVPFLDDANDFYQKKFYFSSVEAGRVLMLPYLTSSMEYIF
jgi:nitrate/nitrite transporter NarK